MIEQKVTVNPIKVQEGYAFKKAPKSDKVPSAPTNNASAASQLQEKEDTPRRNACGYEITREGFNRANWGEYQCIIFSSKEEKARLINITKTNYDLIDGKNVPLPTGCMIGTKEYSSNKIIKDNNLTSCALCCPPGAFKK